MVIDVHNHINPDRIAEAVMKVMRSSGMTLFGSVTIGGLRSSMERAGIDGAIVFCLAEKPSVVKPANDFLISVCDNKRLIGLGTIHPDYEDYKEEIRRLRENSIKGVKFNSLIQNFYPDDEKLFHIYEELGDDMIAFIHGGGPQATPQRLARVLDGFPQMKVVIPHFGGQHDLEEAKRHIVGRNVYLDTSWPPRVADLPPETVADIIKSHGSDKVLFGSDYPTADPKVEIEYIRSLPISDDEKERILWRNAKELFGFES